MIKLHIIYRSFALLLSLHPFAIKASDPALDLQLVGVMAPDHAGGSVSLLFFDKRLNERYGWRHIGEYAGDALILDYSRKTDTATIATRSGKFLVHFNRTDVADSNEGHLASLAISIGGGGTSFKSEALVLHVGTLTELDIGGGKHLSILPQLGDNKNLIYATSFTENTPGKQKRIISEPVVIVKPGGMFTIRVGEILVSAKNIE